MRLVYANFDDGMIAPKTAPWLWRNEAGVAWPAKDEFEVGCTFEHAGYLFDVACGILRAGYSCDSFLVVPDSRQGDCR